MAQLVAQRTFNPLVPSSSLGRYTKYNGNIISSGKYILLEAIDGSKRNLLSFAYKNMRYVHLLKQEIVGSNPIYATKLVHGVLRIRIFRATHSGNIGLSIKGRSCGC